MTARLKVSVLAVLALAAISAFASAAQALPPEFHVEKAPATLKGQGLNAHRMTFDGGVVQCNNSTFHGTQEALTTTTMTLTPTYAGCTAFGFVGVPIDVNGCAFLLHLVAGSNPPTATSDIECPVGQEITITAPFCTIHIEPQVGLSHVIIDNQGAGAARDSVATFTLTGIKYTETAGCPGPGAGVTTNNGTYTGSATVQAFNEAGGAQVGLWAE